MNKRVKKLWLKALRSGEYKQGREQLVTTLDDPNIPDRFCCLGVLQDLYHKENESSFEPSYFSKGAPVDKVTLWAEIDDVCAYEILMNRNDGVGDFKRKHSFKQIANYIEKHL